MIRILTSKSGDSRTYVPMTWEVKKLTELLLGPDCRGVWYSIGETTEYIDAEIEALAKEHGFKVVYEIDPRTATRRAPIDPLSKLSEAELDRMHQEAIKSPIMVQGLIDQQVAGLFDRSGYGANSYRSINQ